MDELPDLNPRSEASGEEAAESDKSARDERVATMRAAVERGLEEIRTGQVADMDAALDQIERMLDEIEAAKRT